MTPFLIAQSAACVRDVSLSFKRMLLTWVLAVRSLITSASAISRLE